jgi:hypothetical protein
MYLSTAFSQDINVLDNIESFFANAFYDCDIIIPLTYGSRDSLIIVRNDTNTIYRYDPGVLHIDYGQDNVNKLLSIYMKKYFPKYYYIGLIETKSKDEIKSSLYCDYYINLRNKGYSHCESVNCNI